MEKHYQLNDTEFEHQFKSLKIDPTFFTHEAHLRLAWIHINNYGLEKSINNITSQIKTFATYYGDNDKYNETVTIAAIRAVYHFILKSTATNFKRFISDNPQLKNEFKRLLDNHYSLDIFKSELAKKQYIQPDLVPFD